MAKLVMIILGVVLFSLVASFMFRIAGDLGSDYNSNDATTYTELSSNYDHIKNISTQSNSSIRRIKSKLDIGIVDATFGVVDSGVAGGKVLTDSVSNLNTIADQIEKDTDFVEVSIFFQATKAVLAILFVLSILFFFWRFKAET